MFLIQKLQFLSADPLLLELGRDVFLSRSRFRQANYCHSLDQLRVARPVGNTTAGSLPEERIPAERQVGRPQRCVFEANFVCKRIETSHLPVDDGSQFVTGIIAVRIRLAFPNENVARLEIIVAERNMSFQRIKVSFAKLDGPNVVKSGLDRDAAL